MGGAKGCRETERKGVCLNMEIGVDGEGGLPKIDLALSMVHKTLEQRRKEVAIHQAT